MSLLSHSTPLIRKLSRLLHDLPRKPAPEPVHRLRTSIRRVEAVVDALPGSDFSKLKKQLRILRRRAGHVRDVDVQLALLRTVRADGHPDQKEAVSSKLLTRRAKREKKLLAALDEKSVAVIRKRLNRVTRTLRENPEAVNAPAVADPIGTALDQFSELCRRYPVLNADSLHAFRTECKRIRYLAETAGDEPDAELVVRELKRIQDEAGAWHDWSELLASAGDVLSDTPHSVLLGVLSTNVASHLSRAQRTVSEVRDSLQAVRGARRKRGPRSARPAPAPARSRAMAAGY